MTKEIKTLTEHPFLKGVDKSLIAKIVFKEQSYKKGAFMIREGDKADTLYLIRSGRVALELHAPGHGQAVLTTLHRGDIAGLSWYFPSYEWHLDARAVEPVTAFAIDAVKLRKDMERNKELGFAMASKLLVELHARLEQMRMQVLDLYKAKS